VFFTSDLHVIPLLLAAVPLAVFMLLVQRRIRSWWLLLPLAVTVWGLVHASGVHATVAGVLLGFTVPVVRSQQAGGPDAGPGLAEHFEHRWRPLSAGVAVPVFAFFATGVTLGGLSGLRTSLLDPVAVGVVVGSVVGKTIGILGASYVLARLTRAELDEDLSWFDVLGLALLGGVGFTVSLLIGELAFGAGTETDNHVKLAVLIGSLLAATLATVVLRMRNGVYRRIEEAETADDDTDGIPDIYRSP
jgi:NhaA family Na+:H+ antiporter